MNVSTDRPACILLKFKYTNTETWRKLSVLLSKLLNWTKIKEPSLLHKH